jgi:hypothetical protein
VNDDTKRRRRDVQIQPRCEGAVGLVVDLVGPLLTSTQPETDGVCELDGP